MAIFEKAFAKTAKKEGGYVNNPNDKGGETYMGICRKFYPKLGMWKTIDKLIKVQLMKIKEINNFLKNDEDTQKDVKGVYYEKYWKPLRLDEVSSQKIAEQLFDDAINRGITATIKLMQRLKGMKVTGKMSNELINKYGKQSKTK